MKHFPTNLWYSNMRDHRFYSRKTHTYVCVLDNRTTQYSAKIKNVKQPLSTENTRLCMYAYVCMCTILLWKRKTTAKWKSTYGKLLLYDWTDKWCQLSATARNYCLHIYMWTCNSAFMLVKLYSVKFQPLATGETCQCGLLVMVHKSICNNNNDAMSLSL